MKLLHHLSFAMWCHTCYGICQCWQVSVASVNGLKPCFMVLFSGQFWNL
jgi:hypothetical protein